MYDAISMVTGIRIENEASKANFSGVNRMYAHVSTLRCSANSNIDLICYMFPGKLNPSNKVVTPQKSINISDNIYTFLQGSQVYLMRLVYTNIPCSV